MCAPSAIWERASITARRTSSSSSRTTPGGANRGGIGRCERAEMSDIRIVQR